jgi:hypothetical protein
MKFPGWFVLTMVAVPFAMAQEAKPTPAPTSDEAIAAFAIRLPDEGSPFFADRELARQERAAAARGELYRATGPNQMAIYPKVRDSDNNAGVIFTSFFTNMFASVRVGKLTSEPTVPKLTVEPEQFSLADRRELDVTYTVKNQTKKIMRLDYPTTQRVEILTSDSNGQVIDRWSDDRSFEATEGIVFINPGERIEYNEKVPTRDMKADATYTITGEVSANPGFEATQAVSPAP